MEEPKPPSVPRLGSLTSRVHTTHSSTKNARTFRAESSKSYRQARSRPSTARVLEQDKRPISGPLMEYQKAEHLVTPVPSWNQGASEDYNKGGRHTRATSLLHLNPRHKPKSVVISLMGLRARPCAMTRENPPLTLTLISTPNPNNLSRPHALAQQELDGRLGCKRAKVSGRAPLSCMEGP